LKPQTGTARLAGLVMANDVGAQPIRRAILLLNGGDLLMARQSTTDDQGRFLFSALPAGRYTLTAWRSGFVRDLYGNKRPGIGSGSPIIVGDGERVDVTMKMTRGAAITGTILPSGVPLSPAVRVQAMQFQTVAGERRLGPAVTGGVSPAAGPGGAIDDCGVYRLYGLAPGEYVIATSSFSSAEVRQVTPAEVAWAAQQFQPIRPGSAAPASVPSPPRSMGYAPVYYPGTTDPAAAATLNVGPGEERSGVDFALQLVPVARIEGTLVAPDGQPPQTAQVTMTMSGSAALVRPNVQVRPTADGKFSATGVMPGHYTLSARAAPRGAAPAGPGSGRGGASGPALWGMVDIDVDGRDITGLVVQVQQGGTVSGRVTFEGASAPVSPSNVRVFLSPAQPSAMMGSAPSMALSADNTFTIPGVAPGSYRVSANAFGMPGSAVWIPRSAMIDGRDALDEAVEIRPGQNLPGVVVAFTDRLPQLSGTLLDAAGKPTSEYFIVAFSTDRRFWSPGSRRVTQARPGNTGAFSLTTLPPGEYYVCAVTDVDATQLAEPAFLESLIGVARKVTLAEGEKKTLDLKVSGGM
jgi:hypothetical protein